MALLRILAALMLFAQPAAAQDKVALVIGNASYQNSTPLANPLNDARAVAAKLESIGFDVALHEDLTGQAFRVALGEFSEKALNADLAIAFYAGHAIEIEGKNYLIPIDAQMKSEATAHQSGSDSLSPQFQWHVPHKTQLPDRRSMPFR